MGKSLLGITLVVIFYVNNCLGLPSVQCAQIGQDRVDRFIWDFDHPGTRNPSRDPFEFKYNYYSIGGEVFSNKFQKALNPTLLRNRGEPSMVKDDDTCYFELIPSKNQRDLQICVNETQVHLRVYYVRQNGQVLNGWLHFEFELVDSNDKILWVYMQVIDENFNAVGEFVHEDYNVNLEQHCPPTRNYLAHPTVYQFLPCTATGLREPKNSQALYMVQPKYLHTKANEIYTQRRSLDRGFHVTWRFGENWCSRHLRIRPDLFILTEKNKENYLKHRRKTDAEIGDDNHRVWRKASDHWLMHEFFGSWDVQSKNKGKLECDGGKDDMYLIMENQNIKFTKGGWISDSLKFTHGTDYFAKKQGIPVIDSVGKKSTSYKSCQVWAEDTKYKSLTEVPKFGGRCTTLFEKFPPPSNEQYQDCERDRDAPEFKNMRLQTWANYTQYLKNITDARNATCFQTCRAPVKNDRDDILKYPPGDISSNSKGFNHSIFTVRTKSTIRRFSRGRKYHGIMCIIGAMFVTPISIFVARYYKETFMAFECMGAKAWYWVHIGTSVANIALYYSSQTAIAPGVKVIGNNIDKAGIIHRVVGVTSHTLFTILILIGGFRVGSKRDKKSLRIRLISILSHSITGFLQYVMNVFLVVQSSWVPASPTLAKCDADGLPIGFSAIYKIAVSWLFIDIAFHGILTTLQFMTDKRRVDRQTYYVLIPVILHTSNDDLLGSRIRKLLLPIYIGVSGIFTFAAVMVVSLTVMPEKCEYGKMSCKDPLGCSMYAQAYRQRIESLKT